MEPGPAHDRVVTVPNALSAVRLALIPVFVYVLLVPHADAWAAAILVFSGVSDWADGKIARLLNQASKLGVLLDPAVDRLYMVTVPIAFGMRGIVPWWIVITLLARDGLLATTLPVLRSRGLSALPVTYVGKAATFGLMSGFPLILLGHLDGLWSRVLLACGWAALIWGLYVYLWAFVLYTVQVVMVVCTMPKVAKVRSRSGGPPGRTAGRERPPPANPKANPTASADNEPPAGRADDYG
jgi:phosphatidylglycerophosphate synthase